MDNARSANNQDSNYDKRLQELAKNLQANRLILKTILKKLLYGLVPAFEISRMVNEPLGDRWRRKGIEKKIQARLSGSMVGFEDTLKLTMDVIDETQSTIDTQNNAAGFRRGLKALMPRNCKQIEEGLSTIHSHLSSLKSFTGYDSIEPERKPVPGIFWMCRDASDSLYYAMQISFHCSCTHIVALELEHRVDDCIGPSFQLVISHESLTHSHETKQKTTALLDWQSVVVGKRCTSAYPVVNPGMGGPTTNTDISTNLAKRIGTNPHALPPNLPLGIASRDDPFASFGIGLDLCEKLGLPFHNKYRILDNLGQPTTRYTIERDPWDDGSQSRSLVSLSDILEEKNRCRMLYSDRMRLALNIASSVLQLHGTPWLPTILTSSHIFFLQGEKVSDPAAMYSRPLLLQHLPNCEAPPPIHVQHPPEDEEQVVELETRRIANHNPTLLSLAYLLIEVLLWQPLGSRRAATTSLLAGGPVDLIKDFAAAQALMPKLDVVNKSCKRAVACCLYGDVGNRPGYALEDEEWYNPIYFGVVALFEEEVRKVTGYIGS